MICIYIQTIQLRNEKEIPFRIFLGPHDTDEEIIFNCRPVVSIPKKIYEYNNVDRLEALSSPPFCDIADELIEILQFQKLIFSTAENFRLLKSQFKSIGYNFNINPTYIWRDDIKSKDKVASIKRLINENCKANSSNKGSTFIRIMKSTFKRGLNIIDEIKKDVIKSHSFDLTSFKMSAGVYFFLNKMNNIIYVGKAKNVRKRLQSHFSNTIKKSGIDYTEIADIDVIYTGNDTIAQLVETENIKKHQPKYNSQQINNAAPFLISSAITASGVMKLKIVRKSVNDSLPEKYFNRKSVLKTLNFFCNTYVLCRKHCGLEKVKGPCKNVTENGLHCVCSNAENIATYNERFKSAFLDFRSKKSEKIYKLKGRDNSEDSFIYVRNGIYESYGYIDKSSSTLNRNDILANHISQQNNQQNNYETARIVNTLEKICRQNILL
ncbi:MAG: GIY-YIG nuclease family protein [Patiriisocius sp.]|uniref:nucleotide excision repair endonuclease n=1 Tax=Patiriisocius sp. TaxID=2822396 RepID=UPI003EF7E241